MFWDVNLGHHRKWENLGLTMALEALTHVALEVALEFIHG